MLRVPDNAGSPAGPARRWPACSRWRGAACADRPGTLCRLRVRVDRRSCAPHRTERRLALAHEYVGAVLGKPVAAGARRTVPTRARGGPRRRLPPPPTPPPPCPTGIPGWGTRRSPGAGELSGFRWLAASRRSSDFANQPPSELARSVPRARPSVLAEMRSVAKDRPQQLSFRFQVLS
jgi:hypothetical protein